MGNWSCPLAAKFLTDQICFNSFCQRSSSVVSDNFYQIILNSDHRFQMKIFF